MTMQHWNWTLDEFKKLSKENDYPKALWRRKTKFIVLIQRVWQWNIETELNELQKLAKEQEN